MEWRRWVLYGMLVLLGFARPTGWSQMSTPGTRSTSPSLQNPHQPAGDDDLNPVSASMHESYAKMQNIDRQRRIVSDTDRLLYLSNRLKTEIAGSGSATVSPDMLREMDEIEKLARNVKNRMRN